MGSLYKKFAQYTQFRAVPVAKRRDPASQQHIAGRLVCDPMDESYVCHPAPGAASQWPPLPYGHTKVLSPIAATTDMASWPNSRLGHSSTVYRRLKPGADDLGDQGLFRVSASARTCQGSGVFRFLSGMGAAGLDRLL